MRPPTITPPTARVDAPRSSPPPGSSPGGFAALLDQTTARTAAAEGLQTRPARTEPSSRRQEDSSPQGDATTTGTTAADQAAAAEASATTLPPEATAADERPAAAAGDASNPDSPPTLYTATDPTAMGAAVLPGVLDPTVAAAVPGTPGAAGLAAPVAAQAAAAAVAPAAPGAPLSAVEPLAAAAEGSPPAGAAESPPAGGLVIPAELLATKTDADAKGSGEKGERATPSDLSQLLNAPSPDTSSAASPPAGTPSAAAAAPSPDTAAAAAPAPAAPVPAATTSPAGPPAPPFAAVPVATPQLTRASITAAAEHVQDLVRIAATRNGGARATLQLKPVELGAVDVHLRTTREGLVATIAAHGQVGLDALQQAGGELRRSLEDRGVQLHRLDLQLGSGQSGFGNGADAREASSGSRRGPSAEVGGADDTADQELSTTTVTSTPAGVLVDVQA